MEDAGGEIDPDDAVNSAIEGKYETGFVLPSCKICIQPTNKAPNGWKIASFETEVIEMPRIRPLSSLDGSVGLWICSPFDSDFYLCTLFSEKRSYFYQSHVRAIAKISSHPIIDLILAKSHSSYRRSEAFHRLTVCFGHFRDNILSFGVYVPHRMVHPTIDSALLSNTSLTMEFSYIIPFLKAFNLIKKDEHDDLSNDLALENSEFFTKFFETVRAAKPLVKNYKLSTEKLTARLRPYQEEAARFMIDRELNPNLNLSCESLFPSIKLETDKHPIYFMSQLGIFIEQEPSFNLDLRTPGGILADEMGLGKTVELLTLITTLTPHNTPEIMKEEEEDVINQGIGDEVKDCLDDVISSVVASVEGAKGIHEFKRKKKERGVFLYSDSRLFPPSPTKSKTVSCEECGTTCIRQRVHWSPGLSAQTNFLCPECIMTLEELIPIKSTLIVLPNSIAHQWYEEIRKHIKEEVTIDVYKGVTVDGYKHPHYLNQFDIVITTYDVIVAERNFLKPNKSTVTLRKRPYERPKMACTPLFSVLWWRVCLDESQMVDRDTSIISNLCKDLKARSRWCITGTPISTTLKDVHGLVNFLGLAPFHLEWIFNRLLAHPYRRNCGRKKTREESTLIQFMSRIMWRTEKKHLETTLGEVEKHVETVDLSPMEERMYVDLLTKSKQKVLQVIGGQKRDSLLSSLHSSTHSRLSNALSQVQLFLLTSLTSSNSFKHKKRDGEVETGDLLHVDAMKIFSPEGLFCRLLKEKKGSVKNRNRELIMIINGMAAIEWNNGNMEKALEYYEKAVDTMKEMEGYNEMIGHAKHFVFNSREDVEEDKEHDGTIGTPLTVDSMQYIHVYRNVQWLMARDSSSSLVNPIDMKKMALLFPLAWKAYLRIEENSLMIEELEWKKLRMKVEEGLDQVDSIIEWTKKIAKLVEGVKKTREEHNEYINLDQHIEHAVGIRFRSVMMMHEWMSKELQRMKNASLSLIKFIQLCFEVLKCNNDVAETVEEGRMRMCDQIKIFKPITNDATTQFKNDDSASIGSRFRKREKKERDNEPIIMNRRHPDMNMKEEEEEEDGTNWEAKTWEELHDSCVECIAQGEVTKETAKECVLCAAQVQHGKMYRKMYEDSPSHLRTLFLQKMEKLIFNQAKSSIDQKKKEEAEKTDMSEIYHDLLTTVNSLDSFWRNLNVKMLEKTNRIRELRQCTVRSEDMNGIDGERNRMETAKTAFLKDVHNLKYVYSLRGDSSSSSSSSSSRECPICLDAIESSWFVFPCAHFTCGRCFNRMISLNSRVSYIHCSTCRQAFYKKHAMLVSTRKKNALCPVDSLDLTVKLDKIARLITSTLTNCPLDKMLVFTSQQLGMDVLKDVFTKAKFPFLIFTGDATVLSSFRNDPEIKILLMSYASGGKGLNLTVANHIILADIVDDPSLEKQAIGRCDRIGQKKRVHVHYVVAKDTMEEKIYELTREKDDASCYIQDSDWSVGTLIDLFNEL